ncbi:MAG: hypothetical protein ACRBB6_02755 [Neptuniibacter sp.]
MKTLGISCIAVIFSISFFMKSYDYLAGAFGPEDSELAMSQAQQEAILKGADPTDILTATAAGHESASNTQEPCRFGSIIGDKQAHKHNDAFYVSFTEGDTTYIQVSPLIPIYLKQAKMQSVSADVITPDEDIRNQLSELFSQRDNCITADLYLQTIHLPQESDKT